MRWNRTQRDKDKVKEGESDEAIQTGKIAKVVPDGVMEAERIGKPKKIEKKPRRVEDLTDPRILLRSFVEIQGKTVKLENFSKAINALRTGLQDLGLPPKPLQAGAGRKEKSVLKNDKMIVKAFLDLQRDFMEAERIGKPKKIEKKPRRVEDLTDPRILLRSFVEIQGKTVKLENFSKAINALRTGLQDLGLPPQPLQVGAEKEEDKKLLVEIRGQGGTKNDQEILSQQKL
ncbi:hypothetical protein [Candidatus Nitrospira allomarina]|uniref:Uncharacterized protein n=1 Tax=Candidatus Nitrospira allomarina TaxID=3020900 RepID=A0AA96GEA8_9BACT|nr:hypothetical protein [Candidatus Nitrospira allomarina]WNM58615.1 hypothetical protein PP769_02280 [Candidatus Nitrospira allomarina]